MEVKTIRINNHDVVMEASYGVNEVFFKHFGSSFKNEISNLFSVSNEIAKNEDTFARLDVLDKMIESALKLAYAMAKHHNQEIPSYEDWVKSLGDIYEDGMDWIKEVAELSAKTFPRIQKGNKQ